MKIRTLIFLLSLFFFNTINAQIFWTENFQNACASSCVATTYVGSNGAWTVTNTGINGADPNVWYVSGAECGNNAGACGSVCGATDPSLHIGSNASVLGDNGASYLAGGLGFWFPETDIRAESPTINCAGQSNITINFNYIENGQLAIDNATLWYFDGVIWAQLIDLAKTALTCNPQGIWTAYSQILPVSANNNPSVKIGFRWVNNDDNVGTDPSFAVDDITLSTPFIAGPTAIFGSSDTTLCVGDCINFNDLSTGSPIAWGWQFTGAATLNSTVQNPTNICYNTPGTFDVALVVFDGLILDTLIMPNFITVNPLPNVVANAAPTTTVCNGDMVTLTGGGASSYTWDNGAVNGVPFPAAATLTYTVTGTDVNGCENTDQITITVNNCSSPTASFIPDSLTICAGGNILFTDNSTGTGISAWSWTFPGGIPATANTQGPHNISFASPGTYNINLSITDANGVDDTTIVVNVITCTTVNAAFNMSSSIICAGDSIVFTDASSAGVTIWAWNFDSTGVGGVSPPSAINQGPHTVFYNNPGTYIIELIVYNGSSFDTTSSTITVNDCSPTANFSASQTTLCEADCITFTNLSTGSPTAWSWYFPGGTPSTASGVNPGTICYPTTGTYNVSLTVSNQYGTDSLYMANLITVNVCTAPTAGITMDDVDGDICINNCIDFTYNGGSGGTPTTINWTFPGGTPSSSTALNPGTVCWNDTTGTFNVTLSVSNANGSSNASTIVTVHELPVVNAGMDTSITIGTNAYLFSVVTDTAGNSLPTTGGVFNWNPTTDLSCAICQNSTVIQPLATNSYIITYTDIYGCQVKDTITVNVDIALNIGVPSAFSPNGDGSNDFLWVKGTIVIKSMNFTIYNRYGQQVFQTTDIEEGWNGTHNGKELNPGVFVYYLNVTFIDGSTKQLKGNVTLVR